VQRLLGIKPIYIFHKICMDCFLHFNILDHTCTTCFVFANVFGNSFQSLFANSQRYINKIFEKHFQDLKFSPPVSNVFPLTTTKLPLNEILLLVFKRVLDTNFWNISQIQYQIEKQHLKLSLVSKNFESWWCGWCGPFALG
jgi:hypothetical protein